MANPGGLSGLKAIAAKVEHALAPAYAPFEGVPGKVLPGPVMPDQDKPGLFHPGMIYASDATATSPAIQVSHSLVGGGSDGQPNYYQQSYIVNNHGRQLVGRDTFEVDLGYRANRDGSGGAYNGTVRQVAESDSGDPGSSSLTSRTTTRIFSGLNPQGQQAMYAQLQQFDGFVSIPDAEHPGKTIPTHVTVGLGSGNLDRPDGGILYLQKQDDSKLSPQELAIKTAVNQAETNAYTATNAVYFNLTDQHGGPPVGGINPAYRAAIIRPDELGGGIVTQVGANTFRHTDNSVDQMSAAPGTEPVHLIGNYFRGIGYPLRLLGLKPPLRADTVDVYASGRGNYTTYDPRLQRSYSASGAVTEKTYIGSQPKPPQEMREPVGNAEKALDLFTHLRGKAGEGLSASFIGNANGNPGCNWGPSANAQQEQGLRRAMTGPAAGH